MAHTVQNFCFQALLWTLSIAGAAFLMVFAALSALNLI